MRDKLGRYPLIKIKPSNIITFHIHTFNESWPPLQISNFNKKIIHPKNDAKSRVYLGYFFGNQCHRSHDTVTWCLLLGTVLACKFFKLSLDLGVISSKQSVWIMGAGPCNTLPLLCVTQIMCNQFIWKKYEKKFDVISVVIVNFACSRWLKSGKIMMERALMDENVLPETMKIQLFY